jgi:hypothetical protein
MRGLRPFRIFLMIILALTPLAQSFWFVRAWRVIDAMPWPGPRSLVQGLRVAAVLVVLAAALELLAGRAIPRRAFGPWGRAGANLWLIASCLGCLAVTAGGASNGSRGPRWRSCRWHHGRVSSRLGTPSSATPRLWPVAFPCWPRRMVPPWDGGAIASSPSTSP